MRDWFYVWWSEDVTQGLALTWSPTREKWVVVEATVVDLDGQLIPQETQPLIEFATFGAGFDHCAGLYGHEAPDVFEFTYEVVPGASIPHNVGMVH